MKIEEVRTSFTVYTVGSNLDHLEGMAESLAMAGYSVAKFEDPKSLFGEIFSNPPHMLLFDYEEGGFKLKDTISQIAAQLPESHVFLAVPIQAADSAILEYENLVYDFILTPLVSPTQLTKAFDRAAERDYFMYLNEQLMQHDLPPPPGSEKTEGYTEPAATRTASGVSGSHYAHMLFTARTMDECLRIFMENVSQLLGGAPAAYFKYFANRRVLAAAGGIGLGKIDINGRGVDFNAPDSTFRTSQLHDPHSIPEIGQMVKQVFGTQEYLGLPVEVLGEIQGVVFFTGEATKQAGVAKINDDMMLLEKAGGLLEAEKRLHSLSNKDPGTELTNRQTFVAKIADEVSRSRRTSTPLSLVLIAVDQYGKLVSQHGQEEANTVLRMMARIFEKHSRINDLIGRTAPDEFGLLLPHTGLKGAMIKAERLRRLIESADFSRVISGFPKFTVSLGVSEYPGIVRDSEELLQSADESLIQVREPGNKTCAATPVDGFVPDFHVAEKG